MKRLLTPLVVVLLLGCSETETVHTSDPTDLGPTQGMTPALHPTVAVSGSGVIAAAWTSTPDVFVSLSHDGGGSWTEPQTVDGPLRQNMRPALAANGANFELTFQSFEGSDMVTAAVALTSSSRHDAAIISEPLVLGPTGGGTPRVAVSHAGPTIFFRNVDNDYVVTTIDDERQVVSMSSTLDYDAVTLCGDEAGDLYVAYKRAGSIGVHPLSSSSPPLPSSPLMPFGLSSDPPGCVVSQGALTLIYSVNDRDVGATVANKLMAQQIDLNSWAAVGDPVELLRSVDGLIEKPVVTRGDGGRLDVLVYSGLHHDEAGELLWLRWGGGEVERDTVAEPRFDSDADSPAIAVHDGLTAMLYTDAGFIGFVAR